MSKKRMFSIAMWLGILADWGLGIPTIFWPEQTLKRFNLLGTTDPVWTAFAALMLILLSLFYIPGAINPYRYKMLAWLSVIARPPGVIFFLLFRPGFYPQFGIMDGILFLIQFPLLVMAMKEDPEVLAANKLRNAATPDIFTYDGSTFQEVRDVVWSDPYPEGQFPAHPNLQPNQFVQFLNDSARNLFDRRDIRPYFDKLIHANGISMTGTWRIDRPSRYTGYFSQGSEGLLLVRLSCATNALYSHQKRSFGIGGKIWPTMDPNKKAAPANFVTVGRLSGEKKKHVLDIAPTNAPAVGLNPGALFVNKVIFRMMDSRPGVRQLYPISTLGVKPGQTVVTPDLMMLRVLEGTPRVDKPDFRDELRLKNYPGQKLSYAILVRSFDEQGWTQLGIMELTADVASLAGDKRLHFWIPKNIANLDQVAVAAPAPVAVPGTAAPAPKPAGA
jgi:hypothetical protein